MPYLMDDICSTAAITNRNPESRHHPALSIFRDTRDKLDGTPRFLLDEAAIHTSVELSLGRPKVLREAMEHLVIPYPRMWIEWPESGREKLRQTFHPDGDPAFSADRPLPDRIGFLLEAEEGGRRGMATWRRTRAWIAVEE